MEITTKYNIGDELWVLNPLKDKAQKLQIVAIEIKVEDATKKTDAMIREKVNVVYKFKDGNSGFFEFGKDESEMFETQEKLINSIITA